jgi:hypothetical protein
MSPGNQTQSPAPSTGAGQTKEGEQGSANTPLPRYVIPLNELRLKEWLQKAKPGERLDLSALAPPPPVPQGAVRVNERTRFYNFRIRYIGKKKTLVILSRGYTFTVCPLQGARIYDDKKKLVRELNDCWASRLFSLIDKVFGKEYNIFSEKWQTITAPETTPGIRTLIALMASLINHKENELKDPFFRACIDGGNSSSKTPS